MQVVGEGIERKESRVHSEFVNHSVWGGGQVRGVLVGLSCCFDLQVVHCVPYFERVKYSSPRSNLEVLLSIPAPQNKV